MIRLDDYRHVAPPGVVDIIQRLSDRVRDRRILHLSGGRFGEGPAEMLSTSVPLFQDLGLDTRWEITGGDATFYTTASALRAALEGAERVLADEALAHYVEMNRINAKKLRLDADLVVVHDVQPAPLVGHRGEGRWVWRCHFDASHAQRRVWSSFRQIINQYDAAVFSLPEFGRRLSVPQYVINPAIDPLSEKNREIGPREVTTILGALRVAQDKALLLQVGAFSRAQDPVGVVNAYRLVKKHTTSVSSWPAPPVTIARASRSWPTCARPRITIRTSSYSSCRRRPTCRSTRSSARPRSCCRSRCGSASSSPRPRRCGRGSPSSPASAAASASR